MGEVNTRSEEDLDLNKRDGIEGIVMWGRFLPRMSLRVLLVEADDSTRQFISALLRKCSYKVTAVSDGLKAWEVLKGKAQKIDLILTEMELPSISGFALLTLIMEHEMCKNIPLIMMSSNDSISTVYKCMMRGAADFLIKPIRKNELKNLWQHVWRRQSICLKNVPMDENVEHKVEATAENKLNNGTSNHSSGYKACVQKNKECIEKGIDAQSSCTKPYMESESTHIENAQHLSHSNMNLHKHCEDNRFRHALVTQENQASGMGSDAASFIIDDKTVCLSRHLETEKHRRNSNNSNDVSSRQAIDLIGAFDNYPKSSYRSSTNNDKNDFDSFPHLILSLRRSQPVGSENQHTDEKHTANPSNASAFSRYINRPLETLCPAPPNIYSLQKEYGSSSDKRFDGPCDVFGSSRPPIVWNKSVPSIQSSETYDGTLASANQNQTNAEASGSKKLFVPRVQSFNNLNQTDKFVYRPELCDHVNFFTVADQSENRSALLIANETRLSTNDENQHRSLRDAALTKFRLKRKARCFDKKVRYESRKKLAEQRPRIKGQFVRHLNRDPTTCRD